MFFVQILNKCSVLFKLYRGGRCTYPCFSRVLSTTTPHNIFSKTFAAFPHNHCRNNGQRWERNESCRNDYHQSSERILAEPWIESATSCFQVLFATGWAMWLVIKRHCRTFYCNKVILVTIYLLCIGRPMLHSNVGKMTGYANNYQKQNTCLVRS